VLVASVLLVIDNAAALALDIVVALEIDVVVEIDLVELVFDIVDSELAVDGVDTFDFASGHCSDKLDFVE